VDAGGLGAVGAAFAAYIGKNLHKVPGVGGISSPGILRSASRTLSVPATERLLADAADLTAEECAAVLSSLVQSIALAGHERAVPVKLKADRLSFPSRFRL
jgi:hypothetical protein